MHVVPPVLNIPAAHPEQLVAKSPVAPDDLLSVPAKQGVQVPCFSLFWKLPAVHNLHASPETEADPLGHELHPALLIAPASLSVPASHLVHFVVLLVYSFGAHTTHSSAPTSVVYLPAAHDVQPASAAACVVRVGNPNFPATHDAPLHIFCPASSVYCPGAHAVHAVAVLATL